MSGAEIPAIISAISAAAGTTGALLQSPPKAGAAPGQSPGMLPDVKLAEQPSSMLRNQDFSELFRKLDEQEQMKRQAMLANAMQGGTAIPKKQRV